MNATLRTYDEIGRFALDSKGSKEAAVKFLEKDMDRWASERTEKEKEGLRIGKPYKGNRETKAIADLSNAISWVNRQP